MPEEIQAAFFKIIVDPLSESLRIPTNFTRRYGNDLPDTVSLKVPRSSKLWEIDLIRADDGEIWLDNGWKEFRDHYSMQFGHLLFFQFDAESSKFDVWIFDMTATQIDYPLDQDDSSVFLEKVYEEQNGDRCNENTDQLGGSRIGTSKTFNKKLMIGNAYRVLLPRDFTEGTGITADSGILLGMNGGNWPVHVNRTKDGQYEICAGFNKFLKENKMIIGSTMKFTFVIGTENTIEARVVEWGTDKTKLFNYVKRRGGKDQCIAPLATQDRARRPRTVSSCVDHANDEGNECESHDCQDFLGGVSKSQKSKEKIVERRLTGRKRLKTGDRCTENTDQLGGSPIGTLKTTKQLMIGDAYRVLLPREFTEGTGMTADTDILLDMNGMKWPVHVNFRKDGLYDICAGWNKFLKDNKMVIGSRMEFTFVTGTDNMIEARVVECGTDKNKLFNYVRRREGKAEFIASLATLDHANDEGNDCELHDSRVFWGKISKSQKGKEKIVEHHLTGRKRLKTGNLLENPLRKLARKVKLTVDGRMENIDTEDCFNDQGGGSSIGMKWKFTKQLTACDVYRLRLRKAFVEDTGIADTDIMLQDVNGKKWPFHVNYAKERRYEIGAGWNDFLVNNKVTIGSKMSFTYIPSSDNTIEARVVKWGTDNKKLFNYVKRRGGKLQFIASPAPHDHAIIRPKTASSSVDCANDEGKEYVSHDSIVFLGHFSKSQKGKDKVFEISGRRSQKPGDLLDNPVRKSARKVKIGGGDRHTENTDTEHCFHNQGGGSSIGISWGFTRRLLSYNAYRLVLPRDFTDSTGITTDSEIMVRDVKGREWPVCIVYRKHGRYDICGGWTDFLRNNDVIIGNTISCTFTSSSSNIIEVRVVKTGTDKRSANQ